MAIWDKLLSTGASHEAKAQEHWNRAQKYFEGKLYNRAIKDLEEALALNPALAPEASELMQMLINQGSNEQAISVGTALVKFDQKNPELFNRLGNALRNTGNFSRARNLYTQALKLNPQFNHAKYNLAACNFGIATADEDLARQTRQVEGYNRLRRNGFTGRHVDAYPVPNQDNFTSTAPKAKTPAAKAERAQKEEELAAKADALRAQLEGEVSHDPESWEPLYNLGVLHDALKRPEEALAQLEDAYRLDPENRLIANNLAVLLIEQQGLWAKAEEMLLHCLVHHAYDRTTILNLAVISKQLGKAFQTLKYYVYLGDLLARSLGEFELDKAEAHALDLFERRKYIEAVPAFENLARELRTLVWLEKLATMYLQLKREDHFIHTLKRILKLKPKHEDALKKLSDLAAQYQEQAQEKIDKGSKGQAAPLLVKCLQIEETGDRWVTLAQVYEDLGEEILAGNALKRWKELTKKPEPSSAEKPLAKGTGAG